MPAMTGIGRTLNLTGQRFGKLVALEIIGKYGTNNIWRLACDCGRFHQANTSDLRRGYVMSCGCSRWTLNEVPSNAVISEAVRRYDSGESAEAVSASMGLSTTTVLKRVRSSGVTIRKCRERTLPLNELAFDVLTSDAAYWLGFLFADGYVQPIRGKRAAQIKLILAEKDSAHLYAFAAFLESGHAIRHKVHNGSYGSNPCVNIDIPSTRLAKVLGTYGMRGVKTERMPVPELLQNRDFWRGVVDGDGSVLIVPRNDGRQPHPVLQLVGSRQIVFGFLNFVNKLHLTKINPKYVAAQHIWRVKFTYHAARKAIHALYSDASTSLARKKVVADRVLATYVPSGRAA
ncbi:MAG: hypothetical protein ABSG07_16770 [Terriglobales bacterium]